MKTHVLFGLILALVAVTSILATEERPGRTLLPPIRPRGILTHVPSTAGGREGIAVRIVPPQRPRCEAGAPVAISVDLFTKIIDGFVKLLIDAICKIGDECNP
jgi:hypothetical protein